MKDTTITTFEGQIQSSPVLWRQLMFNIAAKYVTRNVIDQLVEQDVCRSSARNPFLPLQSQHSVSCSLREETGVRQRERPIKMPPSFSLHSSLVSPHEFIWWQTIPTPPSLSVCTQTYTHSCISSIKMIHREAPHGWHFSKWGMMPVKSSHQWYLCQWLCFLIHACRFSPLLRLRVVLREVSDPYLQISLYHLHLSTLPPPPPPHTFLLAWVIDHYLWPICIPL